MPRIPTAPPFTTGAMGEAFSAKDFRTWAGEARSAERALPRLLAEGA
ncbi:MAG: hypothetical protein ABI306_11190 [Caulobacteraceae bacterium]